MGYSTSPTTVHKILHKLAPLEAGQPCQWTVPYGQESTWAYKVREALFIARKHPEKFPLLALASERFTIEIVNAGSVQARLTSNTPEAVVVSSVGPSAPIHGLEPTYTPDRPIAAVGLVSVRDIISHWLRAQPTNQALSFPDAKLSDEDLQALARFCAGRTPAWVVVKVPGVNVVSLHPIGGDYPESAVVQLSKPSQAL